MSGRITRPGRTVVAVVVAWVVVPLLVVELFARLLSFVQCEPEVNARASAIPGLLFEPTAGPHRLGFRTPDHGFEREAGVYRVVVLGDSVTFGSGVRMEETFSAVAERELNEGRVVARERTRFVVMSAGVPTYNAEQIEATYRHRVSRYELEHVVYAFHPGDFLANVGFESVFSPGFGVVFPKRVVELGVLPEAALPVMRVSRFANMVGTALVARALALDTAQFVMGEDDKRATEERICGMGAFAASRGERFTLALVNDHVAERPGVCEGSWECEESGALLRRVGRAAQLCGVEVLDLTPVLRDGGVDTFLESQREDRCHPNAAGHALLGAALARHIGEVSLRR